MLRPLRIWDFSHDGACQTLCQHLNTMDSEAFHCEILTVPVRAAGGLLVTTLGASNPVDRMIGSVIQLRAGWTILNNTRATRAATNAVEMAAPESREQGDHEAGMQQGTQQGMQAGTG